MERIHKYIWWMELLYILLMLTVGFMEACSLTFGSRIISFFLWPGVFLGGLLILTRLRFYKEYIKMRFFALLILFCLSYGISAILNRDHGFYRNFRILVLLAYTFFIIYGYAPGITGKGKERQFGIAGIYYIVGTGVLSLLSFISLFLGKSEIFYPQEGPIYYIGFHWGRLYGVYWDANIGALMCVAAMLTAMHFLIKAKHVFLKVFLAVYMIFQLCYVSFSGSRTGMLTLCVACLSYTVLKFFPKKGKRAVVYAILSAAVSVCLIYGIKTVYNHIHIKRTDIVTVSSYVDKNKGKVNFVDSNKGALHQNIDRTDDVKDDISNRRFDIWKSAFEIARTAPVFGITHGNVLAYVDDKLPDSYLINNSQNNRFDSMHNTFLDVLVAQGVIGLVIFLCFGAGVMVLLFKNRGFLFFDSGAGPANALYASVLLVMVTAMFVMTEIVYVTSPMSVMFWLGLGCLFNQIDSRTKDN
ncbi:MAG: O-antigen ligase family protein [Parasporobacterium sp.]|nr:O-antigen ligase family protein [Parasporobacterium sp.]